MAAISFPANPSVNDIFTSNGRTWTWNGTFWSLTIAVATSAIEDGSISSVKIADGAITAAKIADGTIVAAEIASNAVTTAKILDANVTADKIASNAVTTAKINANAVTQAKLASNLSGITVTTTANRDTDIPSPFTAQFCFLTDTSILQRYTGSAWVNAVATAPAAPTALSGTALGPTSVSIAFTPGADNGSAITNYQYALSTNGGSTYGSFLALDPADSTSPITISGLTLGTAYTIKLKAVNTMGAGTESAGVSVTTESLTINYLVVAGGAGAGAGSPGSGGGGAGGLRSTVTATGGGGALETALNLNLSTNYTVTVGGGGALDVNGSNSIFHTITSIGGGKGSQGSIAATASSGGSGGGGSGQATTNTGSAGGAGTANQGYAGGSGMHVSSQKVDGGGGGGAGAVGVSATTSLYPSAPLPSGGIGVATTITGSSLYFAGGGGGGGHYTGATAGNGGLGGGGGGGGNNNQGIGGGSSLNSGLSGSGINGGAGGANSGGGGGGGGGTNSGVGAAGGSGVVILRYSSAFAITLGAGLTGSTTTVGSNKVTTITAGSGNVSWA